MKRFKSLLGVLVGFLVFTACPIFGADFFCLDAAVYGCDNEDEENKEVERVDDSENESMLQQLFGPGSLAQGLTEYSVIDSNMRQEMLIVSLLAAVGITGGVVLIKDLCNGKQTVPRAVKTLCATGGSAYVLCGGGDMFNYFCFSYEKLSLIRNIQRARANKHVDSEEVEGYLSKLLGRRSSYTRRYQSLVLNFLENYRESNLAELQERVKNVLKEKEICTESSDSRDLLAYNGDPAELFRNDNDAPQDSVPYYPQCRMLRLILKKGEKDPGILDYSECLWPPLSLIWIKKDDSAVRGRIMDIQELNELLDCVNHEVARNIKGGDC